MIISCALIIYINWSQFQEVEEDYSLEENKNIFKSSLESNYFVYPQDQPLYLLIDSSEVKLAWYLTV